MCLVFARQPGGARSADRLARPEIGRRSREDALARRLMTIPGVGPITATAITALAPPPEPSPRAATRRQGGVTPRKRSTGGKQRLGAISRMGERTLQRLLIIGSSAVVLAASKRGPPKGSWLEQMLTRKPRMLVTIALANETARIVWALLARMRITELRPWRPSRGCEASRKA